MNRPAPLNLESPDLDKKVLHKVAKAPHSSIAEKKRPSPVTVIKFPNPATTKESEVTKKEQPASDDNLILRDVEQLAEATTAQLLATYNALTGRTPDGEGVKRALTRFASREEGKRRVEMAMLAAKDADGHLGVPKGSEGEVKTADELKEKADEKGQPAPNMNPDDNERPQFPPGSMADQLQKAGDAKPPIAKRETKPKGTPTTPRFSPTHVRAIEGGTSKVRDTSTRGMVLARVRHFKDDKGYKPVAIADLDKHMQIATRGYLQKLYELKHIELCDEKGNKVEPPQSA